MTTYWSQDTLKTNKHTKTKSKEKQSTQFFFKKMAYQSIKGFHFATTYIKQIQIKIFGR